MLSTSKKQKIINQILSNEEFSKSKISASLLEYLFEANKEGTFPKEITIAIELFNRNKTFNSNEDSTVRFHVHQLRKKLDAYYRDHGKHDEYRVKIPKGHYQLIFQHNEKKRLEISRLFIYTIIVILLIQTLALVLLFYRQKQLPSITDPISKNEPIWRDFFSNDYSSNIVIGDYFVFEELDSTTQNFRRVMDYQIRNGRDFTEFIFNNPDRKLKWLINGQIEMNAIYNLDDLYHIFYSFGKKHNLVVSSKLSSYNLQEINTVYAGDFFNLNLLSIYIESLFIHVHPLDKHFRKLSVFSETGDTLHTFISKTVYHMNDYNSDFGMIAKVPGFRNENILLLCSFGYFSLIDIVKMMCKSEGLLKLNQELMASFGEVPEYFVCIYQISGYQNSIYSSEMKYVRKIDANQYKSQLHTLISRID